MVLTLDPLVVDQFPRAVRVARPMLWEKMPWIKVDILRLALLQLLPLCCREKAGRADNNVVPGSGNVDRFLIWEVAGLEARLLVAVTASSLFAARRRRKTQELRAMVVAPPILSERIPITAMDGAISAVGEDGGVGTS